MKITGNIITLNEEKHIKECIESLQKVCDEIIVVDSNSIDDTVKIAQELGAKVVSQSYLGDGPQKNVVLNYATYDWVLSIDADERLDEDMIQSILTIKNETLSKLQSYSFKRKNYIGNRWIKYCGWYPDECVRLYDKQYCKFKDVLGHSSVQSDINQLLDGNIIHYSYQNYHELFYKSNRFSTRGAHMMMEKNKKVNSFSPFIHGLNAFIRKYFFQKGFLGGLDGLTIAVSSSLNAYLKYAKLIEMRNKNEHTKSLWDQ